MPGLARQGASRTRHGPASKTALHVSETRAYKPAFPPHTPHASLTLPPCITPSQSRHPTPLPPQIPQASTILPPYGAPSQSAQLVLCSCARVIVCMYACVYECISVCLNLCVYVRECPTRCWEIKAHKHVRTNTCTHMHVLGGKLITHFRRTRHTRPRSFQPASAPLRSLLPHDQAQPNSDSNPQPLTKPPAPKYSPRE